MSDDLREYLANDYWENVAVCLEGLADKLRNRRVPEEGISRALRSFVTEAEELAGDAYEPA